MALEDAEKTSDNFGTGHRDQWSPDLYPGDLRAVADAIDLACPEALNKNATDPSEPLDLARSRWRGENAGTNGPSDQENLWRRWDLNPRTS
jgi:hypothetical protein